MKSAITELSTNALLDLFLGSRLFSTPCVLVTAGSFLSFVACVTDSIFSLIEFLLDSCVASTLSWLFVGPCDATWLSDACVSCDEMVEPKTEKLIIARVTTPTFNFLIENTSFFVLSILNFFIKLSFHFYMIM